MPAPKGHASYCPKGCGGAPPKYTKEFIENEADEFIKWMQLPRSIYYKSFAFSRGYSQQRLTEWAASNEKFAETMRIANDWQEQKLIECSLHNDTNASMTKFVLINKHNWRDKQETVILSADSNNPLAALLTQTQGQSKDLVNEPKTP